jgi:large conductance mechanosensitive channel
MNTLPNQFYKKLYPNDFSDIYKIAPGFQNVLKFILIQDPIKIATGFTMGFFVNNLIQNFLNNIIKPLVIIILGVFSKSNFAYTVLGQTFDIGSILTQLVIFIVFICIFYFGIVNPVDKLKQRYNVEQKSVACPYCKTIINPEATRCPACTSQLNENKIN